VNISGRPEFACINRFARQDDLEDRRTGFRAWATLSAGIDLTLTKLSGRPSGDGEHQLVFMFGAPGGDRYFGLPAG